VVRKIVILSYGKRPDTEDVLQQVLVTIFRDLPRLRNPDAFKTWMYRVACNVIYSHGSRRLRMKALFWVDPDMDARPSFSEATPEQATAQAMIFEQLSRHLGRIKYKKRMAVILSLFFGYVDSEIGDIMGCTTETAKKRVQNGRRELIQSVQKDSHLKGLIEEAAI
jgi:RNA polymerase sigma-70 factor (ECF subfamily)